MVLAPWSDPIPLTRAWCLFELYCVFSTNSGFSITMSMDEQSKFVDDITNDRNAINQMLKTIDVRRSKCFIEDDRKLIFSAIEASVGFDNVNKLVIDKIKEWFLFGAQFVVNSKNTSNGNQIANIFELLDPNSIPMELHDDRLKHLEQLFHLLITRLLNAKYNNNDNNNNASFFEDCELISVQHLVGICYKAVYKYCTEREPHNLSEKIYLLGINKIKEFMTKLSNCQEKTDLWDNPDFIINLFDTFQKLVKPLIMALQYLDRFYIPNENFLF